LRVGQANEENIMAVFTRVNPTAPALGTVQRNFQLTVYKVVLNNSGDATARDADTARALTDEIGTTSQIIQVKSDGLGMIVMGDRHNLDVDTLAIRLGRIIAAGSLTSAGVWTFTGGGTLTVTEPSSLYSM